MQAGTVAKVETLRVRNRSLWLGFHPCGQDEYLAMVEGYCAAYGLAVDPGALRAEAIEWQATRGGRSGRVAWQFFTDLAGRNGLTL